MAQKAMKKTLESGPHLNPLGGPTGRDPGEDTRRQVRLASRIVWRTMDVIIGGIFIYAGAIKVLDPVQFATDIDNYKILPWTISVGLAFYLPWLEILCGLALIARRLYLGGLSILTALVAVFLVATIAAKVRGLDITCGCFGHASQNWNFPTHLALDLAILGVLLALSFRVASRNRLQEVV
jgi:putative oxidoreductase